MNNSHSVLRKERLLAVFQDELCCVSINILEGTRLAWKQEVNLCMLLEVM